MNDYSRLASCIMNFTSEENQTSLGQNYLFARINSGIGVLSMVLNFVVLVGFLTTKTLRDNSFYRLLIPIIAVHFIGSTGLFGYNIVIITYLERIKYICFISMAVGMLMTVLSTMQTVVVSFDRY